MTIENIFFVAIYFVWFYTICALFGKVVLDRWKRKWKRKRATRKEEETVTC